MIISDYDYQLNFIIRATSRLLSLQDVDIFSPSFGCFHLAYWRDKTSEFPDARFQEASATLGILSLPDFDSFREEEILPSADRLYQAFSAGLKCWSSLQYPEGCFDEWYKGERGFAATEFTTIAFGLAYLLMGDSIAAEDRALLKTTIVRSANWLVSRDDETKSNHEAAAAAAIAIAWKVSDDDRFKTAAEYKIINTLGRQQSEGWFTEIGGMDLGYCSVLMDYVMLYIWVTKDHSPLPAMRKLFAYMLPLFHPDGTISGEAGLCLNSYVSRLGIGLFSEFDEGASVFVAYLLRSTPGEPGLLPTLSDDLRLCRWSYLPVVTSILKLKFHSHQKIYKLSDVFSEGWTWRKDSLIATFHKNDTHVYFLPAGGGLVRVFDGNKIISEIYSPYLQKNNKQSWVSNGYNSSRAVMPIVGGYVMESALICPNFFYPSFFSRLILRFGCITQTGSRILRRIIDSYRLKNRTAVNQSSAPFIKNSGEFFLRRSVKIESNQLVIEDCIVSLKGHLKDMKVYTHITGAANSNQKKIANCSDSQVIFRHTIDL